MGNSYYANWFAQVVSGNLKQNIALNEEHLADFVEAALAIELMKERTMFKTATKIDAFPDFYSGLVANLENWKPATCQALGAALSAGPSIQGTRLILPLIHT